MDDAPQIARVRHELRRQHTTVDRIEQLTPQMTRITLRGAHALVVAEVEPGFEYPLASNAELRIAGVPRDHRYSLPGEQLIETLRTLQFSPGRCFAWAATESRAARAIRCYLTNERGFQKSWVKAAGYWQRGAPGVHEVITD